MKIAHLVVKNTSFGGGIEKYINQVGWRLTNQGHEIIVYSMKHYGKVLPDVGGMRIKPIWSIPSQSLEKITSSFAATWDICLKENVDIVHYHSFVHQIPFVPKWFGIPILVQGHGIEWKRSRWNVLGRSVLKLSETICVRSANKLTVVSEVQKKYLKEKYGLDSEYIPTGVNRPEKMDPNLITERWGLRGKDYLFSAGRLVPEKGIHYLIDAFNSLKTEMKLIIAGDSLQEKIYGEMLRNKAQGNLNIIFTGFVDGDLFKELMSNSYAFVLPSELEGLPTVLLEAMSYGNCCIASDIPENEEALKGKGVLFKSRSVEELKSVLEAIIKNPKKAENLREKVTQDVLEFHHWDKIALQFEKLYSRMVEDFKAKR